MSNISFSQVLDDPFYVGENEYISVVTSGKVRIAGESVRDFNKDAAAKSGLLRVNTKTKEVTFIDFSALSEPGDRYRGVEVVNNTAYVMRTQKKHVDSVVRIAAVNLTTNTVKMIEEKAVSIHGTESPKTFCGHFNFGRPIVVGSKIIYPPLNSGVIIVFDTETNTFVAHDVPDDTASIFSTYIPELNEVVFFPYGNKTTKLLVLNLTTNEHKFVEAPDSSTFYHAFTHNGKAYGSPLSMSNPTDTMYFWSYDGTSVHSYKYVPSSSLTGTGMIGFKYGVKHNNEFYTHTCWDEGHELVKFNLDNNSVTSIKTNKALGAKPFVLNNEVYLFPSIQNPKMGNAPASVFKVSGDSLTEEFELPTNNITFGPINESNTSVLLVPFEFSLEGTTLNSELTVIDLENKQAETIPITLALE